MSGEGHIILHIVRLQHVYITKILNQSMKRTHHNTIHYSFKLLIDLYE